MSDSSDQGTIMISGREFETAGQDPRLVERHRARLSEEVAELEALGVRVQRFVLPPDGGPPRYEFAFPQGELHFATRLKLERAGYDVGQHLGAQQLTFYASRRVEKSDGWSV